MRVAPVHATGGHELRGCRTPGKPGHRQQDGKKTRCPLTATEIGVLSREVAFEEYADDSFVPDLDQLDWGIDRLPGGEGPQ